MLSGSLDDFTLPEVLRMLATGKKTGVLSVTRPAGNGRVDFREGDVVYAETELAISLLGQRLVGTGKITEVKLRQSLDVQATTGDRLGHILLVSESISRDDLLEALSAQVEDSAYELMCWEAGDFRWDQNSLEPAEAEISLNVEDLIGAVTGRLEQRDEMRRRIQSPTAVPRMAGRPPEGAAAINITPTQWGMLVLVDGTRNVQAVAEQASVTVEEAGQSLYELASSGLIEVVDEVPDTAAPETELAEAEQRAEEFPQTALSSGPEEAGPPTSLPDGVRDGAPEEWFEDPVEDDSSDFKVIAEEFQPAAAAAHEAAVKIDSQQSDPPQPQDGESPPEPDGGKKDSNGAVAFPLAGEDVPGVTRAAVVRELSGLFDEPKNLEGQQNSDDPQVVERSKIPQRSRAGRPPPPPSQGRFSRFSRRGSGS